MQTSDEEIQKLREHILAEIDLTREMSDTEIRGIKICQFEFQTFRCIDVRDLHAFSSINLAILINEYFLPPHSILIALFVSISK